MSSLNENLDRIIKCKNDIKTALKSKGIVTDGDKFEDFAVKITDFQIESSEPTNVDCIYTNGYPENGEPNIITNLIPYEIELDDNGKFEIELMCPVELYGREDDLGAIVYHDFIFTVDVPTTYKVEKFEFYNPIGSGSYLERNLIPNPSYVDSNDEHVKVVRNDVEYLSYVRETSDNIYCYSDDVQGANLKYRLTIIRQ